MANTYNPKLDEEYQKAVQALESARQNKPSYQSRYDTQAKSLYDQLQNREPFRLNSSSRSDSTTIDQSLFPHSTHNGLCRDLTI